jgi:hypothetical protein
MTSQTYQLDGPRSFTFPFPVRFPGQLTVEVLPGGVVPPSAYTVVGYGPTATQVTVIYPDAPSDGERELVITRFTVAERVATFEDDLGVTARALNAEFDNVYASLQDFQGAFNTLEPIYNRTNIRDNPGFVAVSDGQQMVLRQPADVEFGEDVESLFGDKDDGALVQFQGGVLVDGPPMDFRTVDSVETLRESAYPSWVQRLWLSGYYGAGTPGGVSLYRDRDDVESEDNGSTVFVDVGGVRWKPETGVNFSVPTTQDLRGQETPPNSGLILARARDSFGDWGAGLFAVDEQDQISADDNSTVIVDQAGNRLRRYGLAISTATDIRVGNGERFSSVAAALRYITSNQVRFATSGTPVVITLVSGFVLEEQILASGIDLGWIQISSEDAEVPVSRAALTTAYASPGVPDFIPAFGGRRCTMPRINTVFRLDSTGTDNLVGMYVFDASTARVNAGAGFCGFDSHNLRVEQASRCNAEMAIFDDAGSRGIRADRGSNLNARGASVQRAGGRAVYADRGSFITFRDGNADDCAGDEALSAREGSMISADGATARNAAEKALIAFGGGSSIHAGSSDVSGAGGTAVEAVGGAVISIVAGDASDCGGDETLYANRGAVIAADLANLSSASGIAAHARRGGRITIDNANCENSSVVALSDRGSAINCDNVNTSGTSGTILQVSRGSTINARATSGTGNESDNTLTRNGIIFR